MKNLEEGKEITINGDTFLVEKEIKKETLIEKDKEITYYIYKLSSDNENITSAFIEYFNDSNVIFNMNKLVHGRVNNSEIYVNSEKHQILDENDEFYLDNHGRMIEHKSYKIKFDNNEIIPTEIKVLPEKTLLKASIKINLEDLKHE